MVGRTLGWQRPNALVARPHAKLVGWALATVVLVTLGALAGVHATYALAGAGVVLALGLAAVDLRLFPVLAVPATMLVARVGGTGTGLSVSDLVLFVGFLAALPLLVMREAPELRQLLWIVAAYQAITLITVVNNPYRADVIEWFHEALLVGGALVVGWVVGREGRARTALTLFVGLASIVAVWAMFEAAAKGFQPVYLPMGMQKNYIGDMLAFAAVIAYARPAWVGWTTRMSWAVVAACVGGILASQSKQAMISLAVGAAVVGLRGRHLRKRSKLLLAATVPMIVVAYVTVQHELASSNRFNSVHQRFTWFDQSIQVWHTSELLGVGFRWWYTNRFPFVFQPPNAEFEMLTEAGILGLVALFVLVGGSLWRLWHLPLTVGTLAFALVFMRFVQGQFDIFWVTAQGSLPWLVAGIALGVLARDRAEKAETAPRGPPAGTTQGGLGRLGDGRAVRR